MTREEIFRDGVANSERLVQLQNARLLAAAPDLLASLEHMCDVFGPINDSVGGLGALVQARAAIAKAWGEMV